MSLVVLASAAHSPGVTALGVALTVNRHGPAILVDANREPDQSVLAGYLQGVAPNGRGLATLLQAYRERRPVAAALESALLALDDTGTHHFLPGFAHPGMVGLFAPVWPEFVTALPDEGQVVVDAGRIGVAGLSAPLAASADLVAVVTGSRLVDLAALRLYLPGVVEAAGEERTGLVVVGPDRPYSVREIRDLFGVPVLAGIDWNPAEAAHYATGAPAPRARKSSGYLRSVQRLASVLAEREAAHRALVGSPARAV